MNITKKNEIFNCLNSSSATSLAPSLEVEINSYSKEPFVRITQHGTDLAAVMIHRESVSARSKSNSY